MSEQRDRIAELYYLSNTVRFGLFKLSIHQDHPELPLSPWYMHYPKDGEPGTEHLPELYDLIGKEFYAKSEAQKTPIVPRRIAGLPKGALPLGDAYAGHYESYPENLLKFGKKQHDNGTTEFVLEDGRYEVGDILQPCEDHVSGARNNLLFLSAVRRMGLVVTNLLVVVDRQQGGPENLAAEGVRMIPIFTGDELLQFGVAVGHISLQTFEEVQTYRQQNQYSLAGLKQNIKS